MISKKAPGVWTVRVSVLDKNKGYPIAKQRTVTGSKMEAEAVQIELKKQIQAQLNGSLTYTHRIRTFSEAIDLYRERLQKKLIWSNLS